MLDQLQTNVMATLGGIFGLLIVATAIGYALKLKNREKDYGELLSRIHSWWVMAGIFTLAILLSRYVSLLFFAFISFLALKEYLSLIPTRVPITGCFSGPISPSPCSTTGPAWSGSACSLSSFRSTSSSSCRCAW